MLCLYCFSKEPLSEFELGNGKYGTALGPYANNSAKYDISLCQAPCKEPLCCLASFLCFCPAQIYMRRKVLNHVDPGSGWSNYICCQGKFGGFCCFQPGSMGESKCPVPCMCLEASCCPGPAVSASSLVIREQYQLGLDEDDIRLIRCNNCIFILTGCLGCIAMCTPCQTDDYIAAALENFADILFLSIGGCVIAQMNREMKVQAEMPPSPESEMMIRD